MYKIVNGKELKGTVNGSQETYFYGGSGRNTAEEYKQLLLDSQDYFSGIENGTIALTDKYFIYAPENYLQHGIASSIAVIRNDQVTGVDARELYQKQAVKVKRTEDGYVFAGADGRHRFIAAQQYNLKLLVDIEEDK